MNISDVFTEQMKQEISENEADFILEILESGISEMENMNLQPLHPGKVLSKNNLVFYDTSLKKPNAPKNIRQFMDLVEDLIKEESKKATWLENTEEEIRFVPLGLDKTMQTNCIVHKVIQGEPGPFGRGRPHASNTLRYNPFLREIIDDPDDPNYKLFIYSKIRSYTVEFCACSQRAREADELIDWLQSTLENYIWYFKYSGIQDFRYLRRNADYSEERDSNRYYSRPVQYYVLTEELSYMSFAKLRRIISHVSL